MPDNHLHRRPADTAYRDIREELAGLRLRIVNTASVDGAHEALMSGLAALPLPVARSIRRHFTAMLLKEPESLFVIELEGVSAGPTKIITDARLKPSKRYFDLLAAIWAVRYHGTVKQPPKLRLLPDHRSLHARRV